FPFCCLLRAVAFSLVFSPPPPPPNAASGEQHRHWPGVFDIRPQEDGSVVVHSYTTVYASPRGGESRVHRVCTCTDVLVRQGGRLLVRTREVARDDLR
ncbi:hypothetical protein ACFXIZ_02525, partial [Streptomyces mirabilis]